MSNSCTPKDFAVNETAKKITDKKWWYSFVPSNIGGDVHGWIISYNDLYKKELKELDKKINKIWIKKEENINELFVPIPIKGLIQTYSKTISFIGNP